MAHSTCQGSFPKQQQKVQSKTRDKERLYSPHHSQERCATFKTDTIDQWELGDQQ